MRTDKVQVLSFCGTFERDYAEIREYVSLDDFEKVYDALKDLLDEVESLEGVTHSRDFEPYKAEAVWDDVQRNARKVLERKP